jgi:HlyD family secretion protein
VRFAGDTPADLRQNQRVSVRIVLRKADALIVDRGAFFESGGGPPHLAAARRHADRDRRPSIEVEIAQGLKEGDQIVISSLEPFGRADTVLIRN